MKKQTDVVENKSRCKNPKVDDGMMVLEKTQKRNEKEDSVDSYTAHTSSSYTQRFITTVLFQMVYICALECHSNDTYRPSSHDYTRSVLLGLKFCWCVGVCLNFETRIDEIDGAH